MQIIKEELNEKQVSLGPIGLQWNEPTPASRAADPILDNIKKIYGSLDNHYDQEEFEVYLAQQLDVIIETWKRERAEVPEQPPE